MSVLRKSLLSFRSFLVNFIVWLFIIIVYGPLLLVLACWRYFVNFLAVRLDPDLIPCSPNDTLLVHETPDVQPVLTGGFCLKVKGTIDAEKLSTLFEELFLGQQDETQLQNYQNLYCDLVKFCGYLFKRKIVSKVKLQNHFVLKELGSGEDFKKIVASWFQEKFQKGLPLWQMQVLNGVEDEYSYFCFKAHHVLMDGYSFVHILDKLTGLTSPGEWGDRSNSPTNNNNKDEDVQKIEQNSFWRELQILFSIPETVASFTFPNFTWGEPHKFPESKPLSNFEMLPMACGSCPLKTVREIRRRLGVHFPAIIYGLQTGVIRAAMLDGCVPNPSSDKKSLDYSEQTLPRSVLITASLPVLGREHPRNKLTNHWSGGYIKVPLKTESAKERVEEANRSLENIMRNEGTYIVWKYMAFLVWLVPSWVHALLDKSHVLKLCRYRSSMSCIPQSCTVQYQLMGLPVENIFHAPVMKDSFLTAVLLGCSSSHHEQVDLSLFGHPEWFPDQEKMNKAMQIYMKKELETLATECGMDSAEIEWKNL